MKNSIEEMRLEIEKQKENELLLIRYPDLYGPIEQFVQNEHSSPNELCAQMNNQINANERRINLLVNLNKKLLNSVIKLKENKLYKKISNDSKESQYDMDIEMDNQNDSLSNLLGKAQMVSAKSETAQEQQQQQQHEFDQPIPLYKLDNLKLTNSKYDSFDQIINSIKIDYLFDLFLRYILDHLKIQMVTCGIKENLSIDKF
jgi:hypothetical protein